MPKAYFIPPDDLKKCALLSNFAAKLPAHAPLVGVTPAEVAAVQADNLMFAYACDATNQFKQCAQEWVAFKNALRNGSAVGNLPVAPALAGPPAPVPTDIFGRNSALGSRLKKHAAYTDAMGQDLGLIGAEQTTDLVNLKPTLKVQMQAGHPNILWTKQGMDGLEIWVDRGNGFAFLAIDTVPDYLDTAALPAAGARAVWKYKAIYRLHDEQVGQWSDVASVSVMG
ncbi:MAG: hypothetical protein HY043_18120 [Verrucomicrobia bacterium]|nr:hypothetical protein [Verrucomicrobiota bacterium]